MGVRVSLAPAWLSESDELAGQRGKLISNARSLDDYEGLLYTNTWLLARVHSTTSLLPRKKLM